MGPSKNILNATPKKMGRRELGRPIFLEAIFGVTQMLSALENKD
jgi:hypothetical protein